MKIHYNAHILWNVKFSILIVKWQKSDKMIGDGTGHITWLKIPSVVFVLSMIHDTSLCTFHKQNKQIYTADSNC